MNQGYELEYRCRGNKDERLIVFEAKNKNDARLKMMKFTEKGDVFVKYIGREKVKNDEND